MARNNLRSNARLVSAMLTLVLLQAQTGISIAQTPAAALPANLPGVNPMLAPLDGVYDVMPDDERVPGRGGGGNHGSVDELQPRPGALVPKDRRASNIDPSNLCEPIGPFRMLSQPELRIQLVAGSNRLVVLFQDLLRGYLRSLYLDQQHPPGVMGDWPWQGNSVAHWQGDTLIVDTIGFNDRTWLNGHVRASDALHLRERLRLLDGGHYLSWQITATDPKSLQKPYSYVRYFRRVDKRIEQDICKPHTDWTTDDGI